MSDEVQYKDDDLVYVDPDKRIVVGLVEWSTAGKPKALLMQQVEEVEEEEVVGTAGAPTTDKAPKDDKGKKVRRRQRRRYYPWGTYRSMKRIYKLEGKVRDEKTPKTLDEAIELSQKEPFWD